MKKFLEAGINPQKVGFHHPPPVPEDQQEPKSCWGRNWSPAEDGTKVLLRKELKSCWRRIWSPTEEGTKVLQRKNLKSCWGRNWSPAEEESKFLPRKELKSWWGRIWSPTEEGTFLMNHSVKGLQSYVHNFTMICGQIMWWGMSKIKIMRNVSKDFNRKRLNFAKTGNKALCSKLSSRYWTFQFQERFISWVGSFRPA